MAEITEIREKNTDVETGEIDWSGASENAFILMNKAHAKLDKEVQKQLQKEASASLPTSNRGITVSGIFRRIGNLVPNPDRVQPRSYERMLLNPRIRANLDTIVASVVRSWELVGGSEEARKMLTKNYKDIGLKAILAQAEARKLQFGHITAERVWGMEDEIWKLLDLKVLISKDVEYKVTEVGEIKQAWQYVSARNNFPTAASRDAQNVLSTRINGVRKFTQIKFSHMSYKPMFGNPYGTSILAAVNKAWILMDHMLRYWARFLEILGGGMIIGKSGMMKPKIFQKDLDKAKSTSTIAIRSDQELDIKWPQSKDSPFSMIVDFFNSQMSEAMHTPEDLIGKSQGGTKEATETHFAMFKLTMSDPEQDTLDEFMRPVNKILVDFNLGEPGEEGYPSFKFDAWTTLEREQLANFYRKLAMMQVIGSADVDWIRENLGLPPKDEKLGIGEPMVKIQDEMPQPGKPGTGSGGDGQGDSTDSTDSTKREAVGGDKLVCLFHRGMNVYLSSLMRESLEIKQSQFALIWRQKV